MRTNWPKSATEEAIVCRAREPSDTRGRLADEPNVEAERF